MKESMQRLEDPKGLNLISSIKKFGKLIFQQTNSFSVSGATKLQNDIQLQDHFEH